MCGIRSRGGRERQKNFQPASNIDFSCPYFDNRQKFAKEGNVSKKKVGDTDLFKPQNPGEVVVLAKSATFAYKSFSVRALDE